MTNRELMSGFVRLHILHHAAHEPVYGIGIIEELARHGYDLSAGTLYPILHGLEKNGYLRSRTEIVDKKRRRLYVITAAGKRALAIGKTRIWELFREVFEDEFRTGTKPPGKVARHGR